MNALVYVDIDRAFIKVFSELQSDVIYGWPLSIIASLDGLIALLELVVDAVLLDALYVVAMVFIVAHMDHVKKGIPILV